MNHEHPSYFSTTMQHLFQQPWKILILYGGQLILHHQLASTEHFSYRSHQRELHHIESQHPVWSPTTVPVLRPVAKDTVSNHHTASDSTHLTDFQHPYWYFQHRSFKDCTCYNYHIYIKIISISITTQKNNGYCFYLLLLSRILCVCVLIYIT